MKGAVEKKASEIKPLKLTAKAPENRSSKSQKEMFHLPLIFLGELNVFSERVPHEIFFPCQIRVNF